MCGKNIKTYGRSRNSLSFVSIHLQTTSELKLQYPTDSCFVYERDIADIPLLDLLDGLQEIAKYSFYTDDDNVA